MSPTTNVEDNYTDVYITISSTVINCDAFEQVHGLLLANHRGCTVSYGVTSPESSIGLHKQRVLCGRQEPSVCLPSVEVTIISGTVKRDSIGYKMS